MGTVYQIDEKLARTLEALRAHYQLALPEDALRRAVALLKIFSENEQADGSVWFKGAGPSYIRVFARGGPPPGAMLIPIGTARRRAPKR